MSGMPIRYEKDDGHIVLITIDRPPRNALDMHHFRDLAAAWRRFKDDPDAWVAIITGVGDAFRGGLMKGLALGLSHDLAARIGDGYINVAPQGDAVARYRATITFAPVEAGEVGDEDVTVTIPELPEGAVRRRVKLPPPVLSETYNLEYGTAALEIPADGIELAGRSVVIIDDVLATGGTIAATARLLRRGGATAAGAAVVLELAGLGGRDVLKPLPVSSLHTV